MKFYRLCYCSLMSYMMMQSMILSGVISDSRMVQVNIRFNQGL